MAFLTASPSELLEQASHTAESYLCHAVRAIDRQFGDGFAKKHPDLVAAYMKTACEDFNTSISLKIAERIAGDFIASLSSRWGPDYGDCDA